MTEENSLANTAEQIPALNTQCEGNTDTTTKFYLILFVWPKNILNNLLDVINEKIGRISNKINKINEE